MERIESVDVFRLIAIVAVIVIHTTPFRGDVVHSNLYNLIDILLSQISRFAVPFFFVISGYFWGVKIRNGAPLASTSLAMASRIAIIFLVWSLIYLLPYNIADFYEYGAWVPFENVYSRIENLIHDPVTLVMEGTRVHLWFLMALLCALFLTAILVDTGKTYLLVVFSILLYLFGLLAKAYANTPAGIEIEFNTRNGPFFSTIFFACGYLLSGKKISEKWLYYGLFLFVFGCVMQFAEIFTLWTQFRTIIDQDYVIGTFFMGTGVALAALSNHPVVRIQSLSKLGRLTLGIYVVHFIFVDIFDLIDRENDSFLWETGYVILVLILSIVTVQLLSKHKMTRRLLA